MLRCGSVVSQVVAQVKAIGLCIAFGACGVTVAVGVVLAYNLAILDKGSYVTLVAVCIGGACATIAGLVIAWEEDAERRRYTRR